MPGAPSSWIDTWAPAQYMFGSGGAPGPVQASGAQVSNGNAQTYDSTLTWKIAGTIILALAMVFVLQQLGFRFVIAAGVGG